jgi:hypothetical protein
VPRGGATDDFVDEEVGWFINAEKKSVKKVYGHQLDTEGFLLEPDKKQLEIVLRIAYESNAEIVGKGIKGALRVRKNWTWNHSVLQLLSRIDALCGTSMGRKAYEGSKESCGDTAVIVKAIERKHALHD